MREEKINILRNKVLDLALKAYHLNLVTGAEGNFSVRVDKDSFAITPLAVEYDEMQPSDIVIMKINGEVLKSKRKPSTEWRLHAEIYREYSFVNSVVHVHPIFSTVISVIREEIPVILDEQVFYIGGTLRVSDYAPSGTMELATNVVKALKNRRAAIIANHGLVAVGKDEKAALYTAIVAEKIAKIYYFSKMIGSINLIPKEIVEEFEKKSYGRYTD